MEFRSSKYGIKKFKYGIKNFQERNLGFPRMEFKSSKDGIQVFQGWNFINPFLKFLQTMLF